MILEEYTKVAILLDSHVICNSYVSCHNPRRIPTIDIQLAHLVCQTLDVYCKILIGPDNEFGRLLPDGNWSGLIGMIKHGEADLAVSTIGMTEERVKAVKFSYPVWISEITFITNKPEHSHDIWTLIHPFSMEIWIILLIYFIILPFVLYYINKKKISFKNIAFDVIRPFFLQPSITITKKHGQSIMMLLWITSMTLLSYCYSAVLLSFLAFPPEKGVHNIKELAAAIISDGYKCATYPGTYYAETFRESIDESTQIIGKSLNIFTYEIADVLRNHENQVAFIAPKTDFAFLGSLYYISNEAFYSSIVAFAVGENFCCKERLDVLIKRINAAGLINHMFEKEIFLRSLPYNNNSYTDFNYEFDQKLTIRGISSSFFFLFCGYSFAFIVLLIELIVWYST